MKKVTPKTEDHMVDGPMIGSPTKNKKEPKKIYPRLHLEHSFFPEAKDQKVGSTYTVKLKVKMTGLSIARFQNDSEYDIVEYEFDEEKGEKPEDDE